MDSNSVSTSDIASKSSTTPNDVTTVWQLEVLDAVNSEARKLLSDEQLQHVFAELLRMAQCANPIESSDFAITHIASQDPQEVIFVARDHGGVLKDIDLRILFSLVQSTRVMVVLGMLDIPAKKKLPNAVVILSRYRLSRYLEA